MASKEIVFAWINCLACLGLFLYRLSQCALYRPTIIQATVQRLEVDSNLESPVCNTECFSTKRKHPNKRSVLRLFLWSCPATVFWRVTFRAIDSVNAVRRGRLRPHVCVEVFKRLPSLAYCDSFSTVPQKGSMVGVSTSLSYLLPSIVLRCSGHAVFGRIPFSHDSTLNTELVRAAMTLQRPGCLHFSTLAIGGPI